MQEQKTLLNYKENFQKTLDIISSILFTRYGNSIQIVVKKT